MNTQIIQAEQTAMVQAPPTPFAILQTAVDRGADVATIERLAALAEHMEQRQAEKEFNSAMSRAQAAMTRISADATNPQTHSKYATYAKLDSHLRPIYTREGLSLSFDTDESSTPESVLVVCYVTRESYCRKYRLPMPADGKGARGGDVMTKTHATGAATAYGMRYLLKMIFNVAVGEDDRDGNGSTEMPDQQYTMHTDNINGCATLAELQKCYNAAYADAKKANDQQAIKQFEALARTRKQTLVQQGARQ